MLPAVEAAGASSATKKIRPAGIVPVKAVDRLPLGFNDLTIFTVLWTHRDMITENEPIYPRALNEHPKLPQGNRHESPGRGGRP